MSPPRTPADRLRARYGHLGPEDHELGLVLEHLRGWLAHYPVTVFPDSHLPARMARHVLSSVIADLEVGRHRE